MQIPNTVPAEYFWVANHQKSSVYDGLSRGSNLCWVTNRVEQDPYCPVGKGIYIYHQSSFTCINNSWLGYEGGFPNRFYREMDIENAEGKYNWQRDRVVSVPELGGNPPNYPIFKIFTGNSQTGRDEYGKYVIDLDFAQLLNNKECGGTPDYTITWDDKGDGLDAYNLGYDEIISPYSNPATNSCQDPSNNNGLTIKLLSQDTITNTITVKIYFNDNQALLDLPPSKPKSVKVTKAYFGGTGSDQFHPSISWDQNIEPDFYSASNGPTGITPVYEIYRGGSSDCNVEPGYVLAATVSSNTTQYIDYEVTLHDPNFDQNPICPPTIATFSYKVLAKDNRGLRSLNSERGLVSGYQNGCTEAEGPDSHTGNNISTDKFSLSNYPNPFNPNTKIYYSLPKDGMVRINVYNNLGQKIKEIVNEFKTTGKYYVEFEGSSLSSGIYYYKIEVDLAGQANGFIQTKKMILIK